MTLRLGKKNRELLALLGIAAVGAACSQSGTMDVPDAEPAAESASMTTDRGGTDAGAADAGRGPSSAAGASSQRAGTRAPSQAGRSGASAQAGAPAQTSAGRGEPSQAGSGTSSSSGVGGTTAAGAPSAGIGGTAGGDASVAGQGAAGQGVPTRPSTWRMAFLGDSITETSCTSQLVHAALRADGHTNIDLVGTMQNKQSCGVDDPDRDVEGHSGYLVTHLVGSGPRAAELPMWCAADRADLVLMHFGTNDAWNGAVPIMNIVSAFSEVLAALREAQPRVIVFVAQIIPLSPDNCETCEGRVRELNALLPMWAASESTSDSPVYVVDQWTGFDPSTHAYDRVHPNMMGSQKMADVWLGALRAEKIF